MKQIRIVGVIDEDPFNALTWSGSAGFFFNALKKQGSLVTAYSADPGTLVKKTAQVLSFSPNLMKWKRKYHLSTFLFGQMSRKAAKKIDNLNKSFNVIIQVGAWYNLLNNRKLKDKFFCSYHDGNFAMQLKRKDINYNSSAKYIKRAFEYEKRLYHGMDLIFPMSEWLRRSFIEDFGCEPSKVVAVGAGINLYSVPEIKRKDYSRPEILFIGVDFVRKGGKVLLEAFKIVKKEIPEAKLTIIGPQLNDLPDGVTCLGRIMKNTEKGEKKLCDEYSKASLFVMPSFYEPFGIVFAEAMAHKLPCIGTNNCAMTEIIDDGETGYFVPVGDEKILALKIIDILKDHAKARKFGEAGYKKYLENFTWEIVAEKISVAISANLENLNNI